MTDELHDSTLDADTMRPDIIPTRVDSPPARTTDSLPPVFRTITAFLSSKGYDKGVDLERTPAVNATAILEVEGGRKYEIGRIIAKGGMGVICLARDVNCRRTVAMKMLPKDTSCSTEDLLRFIEEAQITSQLEHPNIVPVHEVGLDAGGNVFYTMKYVKGMTLTEALLKIRRGDARTIEQFPLARLLNIFQKACDAVAFAHSKNVVHRDLKPDNIMIGDYGEVVVMDWGLAKVMGGQEDRPSIRIGKEAPELAQAAVSQALQPDEPRPGSEFSAPGTHDTITSVRTDKIGSGLRTISGRVMGTPGFMAPEQARADSDAVNARSDIYSLGAILYSILALRPPISEKDFKVMLEKTIRGEIEAPIDLDRKIALLHCPGGTAPKALSAIAMKALATAPPDRFPTVQALQREIESYQNGEIWHLVVEEDFANSDFLDRWEVIGGQQEIRDGELRLYNGKPQILLLRRDLPGDIRIEFDCRMESVYLNTIGCFVSAIRSRNRKEIPSSGYELKYGGYDNSLNVLMKSDQKIWSRAVSPLARGASYRVVAERIGSRLRLMVNNEEVFSYIDPDPLTGSDRTAVGLTGWVSDTRYARIRVYSLGTPWKGDMLDIAERQLQKGQYGLAMGLFQEVMGSYPDADRLARAKKGYETAVHRENMVKSLAAWRRDLERAWPRSAFEIRLDNDGLTVEATGAGLTDLEALRGLPVNNLYCAHNLISSLEPLRGMPLRTLNCSDNPLDTLEPLRGMPLTSLIVEGCRIARLDPLRGMPLTLLNCGGNRLADGLEPLRGMSLAFLGCWGNELDTLDPIRGMPLTALYCGGNRIESLEPLRGMPLNVLHASGNRLRDLEPLRGSTLTALHCSDNRIESLEPLTGLPLNMLSSHGNLIVDVRPLAGMPLGHLTCGHNPLRHLGPFETQLPEVFQFDGGALTDEDLRRLRAKWEETGQSESHLRQLDTLLALRRNDGDELRRLATPFRNGLYLFIPLCLRWPEARTLCEKLGGHLLTIHSQEENDFVVSLFPGGAWFWLGLFTEGTTPAWINGEPYDYECFADVLREKLPGPKVFNGFWTRDDVPDAHNEFMIKWDV